MNEQLQVFKQLRNVESPAMNVGDLAKKAWAKTKDVGGKAVTFGNDRLGDLSPGLRKAAEEAANKLKSAFRTQ